jgi:uncharacterized protein DUF1206
MSPAVAKRTAWPRLSACWATHAETEVAQTHAGASARVLAWSMSTLGSPGEPVEDLPGEANVSSLAHDRSNSRAPGLIDWHGGCFALGSESDGSGRLTRNMAVTPPPMREFSPSRGARSSAATGSRRKSLQAKIAPTCRVLARVGCFTIGTLYVLIGLWAMLALMRVADPAADEQRILTRIQELPFGSLCIAFITLGTVGYILWLLFEAIFDPYELGRTPKGVTERVGIGLSTLAYGVIVSAAVRALLGAGGHGEEKQQRMVAQVLDWPGGQWLVGGASVLLAGVAVYQLKYVYDRDHLRRIDLERWGAVARTAVNALGWAGHAGRCAILLVLSWFLLHAAWSFDPQAMGDTDSAFDFLGLGGGPVGNAVFAAVGLGTIAYGVFLYVNGVFFRFGAQRPKEDGRSETALR